MNISISIFIIVELLYVHCIYDMCKYFPFFFLFFFLVFFDVRPMLTSPSVRYGSIVHFNFDIFVIVVPVMSDIRQLFSYRTLTRVWQLIYSKLYAIIWMDERNVTHRIHAKKSKILKKLNSDEKRAWNVLLVQLFLFFVFFYIEYRYDISLWEYCLNFVLTLKRSFRGYFIAFGLFVKLNHISTYVSTVVLWNNKTNMSFQPLNSFQFQIAILFSLILCGFFYS